MANKQSKLNFITGVAAFALVLGAGPAFAQYNSGSQTQKSNPGVSSTNEQTVTSANAKTPADDAFAQKAVQADMAEVKLGQLAEQKGTNPAVRDFGKRMVQDHSKNENDLTTTASRENVALPSGIDKADQNTYDRLSKLSGDSFDRAYARDMVKDHTKDVAEFQKEAKDGHDEAIKNYAQQTVPILQSHLDQARRMEQTVTQSASNHAPSNGTAYPSNNTVPATR